MASIENNKPFGFIGGGIGLIILWYVFNHHPEYAGLWATSKDGARILYFVQLGLFGISLVAFVFICSMANKLFKGVKISKIKIRDLEVTFKETKPGEVTQTEEDEPAG